MSINMHTTVTSRAHFIWDSAIWEATWFGARIIVQVRILSSRPILRIGAIMSKQILKTEINSIITATFEKVASNKLTYNECCAVLRIVSQEFKKKNPVFIARFEGLTNDEIETLRKLINLSIKSFEEVSKKQIDWSNDHEVKKHFDEDFVELKSAITASTNYMEPL